MLRQSRQSVLRRFFCLMSQTFVLSLVALSVTYGQGFGDRTRTGGTGGHHTIQGRIQTPSNRPLASVRVVLESTNSSALTAVSDTDGVFRFSSLEPGNYKITIDGGNDYETVRESVYIDKERRGNTTTQTFNVPIYLRPKGSAKPRPGVINAALAEVPKAALKAFEKALEESNKRNVAAAAEKFNEAIALHPSFFEAHAELGVLYLKTNQLDKACEMLGKALELNGKNLNTRLNYGVALLNKKEMAAAEAQLREVVKGDETAATPRMYLGIALLGLKRLDEAEAELLRAISIKDDEKLALAHRYLGGIYWGKGNYKQAADALEKYLKLSPQASDAERIKQTVGQLRAKQN